MKRRLLAFAALSAIAVAAGFAALSAFGAQGEADRPRIGPIPGDVNGDGLVSDSGAERIPTLIAATGDRGIAGYVRISDLDTPAPKNPAEALRRSKQERVIRVFAADGRTVVDDLTVRPDAGDTEQTTVPDVVGLPSSEAIETAQNVGLQIQIEHRPGAVAPSGTVVAQIPAGGSTIAEGAALVLVVSSGEE